MVPDAPRFLPVLRDIDKLAAKKASGNAGRSSAIHANFSEQCMEKEVE
jgi:hypothetical protein